MDEEGQSEVFLHPRPGYAFDSNILNVFRVTNKNSNDSLSISSLLLWILNICDAFKTIKTIQINLIDLTVNHPQMNKICNILNP